MNVRCYIKAIISIVIVFLCLFTSIQLCFGVSETRFMRGDQHTVNGLLAYALNTTQSSTEKYVKKSLNLLKDAYWGIRVYKRDSEGTETQITSDVVAVVTRSSAGSGIQSNTWNCPETALDSTDAIVVKVYHKWTAGSWVEIAKFTTPQLGAETLDSSTWTVYYWTKQQYSGFPIPRGVDSWFYWGTSTYNSRIVGFDWTEATAKEWHDISSWAFNLTTMQWHNTTWSFNISAMQWIEVSTWIFNLTGMQFHDIATWVFNITARQWLDIVSWSFNIATRLWQDAVSWSFDVATRVWQPSVIPGKLLVETTEVELAWTKLPTVTNDHITRSLPGFPVEAEFSILNKAENSISCTVYAFLNTSHRVIYLSEQHIFVEPDQRVFSRINFSVPFKNEAYTLHVKIAYYYGDELKTSPELIAPFRTSVGTGLIELLLIVLLLICVCGVLKSKKSKSSE